MQHIASLYINDWLFIDNDSNSMNKFKHDMKTQLEMIDFGEMNYFLGKEIHQCDAKVFIIQRK